MTKRLTILGLAVALAGAGATHAADCPSWWTNRSVIVTDSGTSTNDYAGINAGQFKWIATNAYDELEANLPGGAGTNVENVISLFSSTNNHQAVNLGQLKNVALPFYDRLIDEGYTNAYPWTGAATTNDYAAANIGQIKNLFSFDLLKDSDSDGLADWVETNTDTFTDAYDTGSDPNDSDSDDDGISDGDEVDNLTDPNNNDTTVPSIVISMPTNNTRIVWIP